MSAANKKISAQTPQGNAGLANAVWHADPDACGCPGPAVQSWLNEKGLLTARLRSCCGPRFNMRVLRDQPCTNSARLHREVLLCCDESACIFAVTDVPAATLSAHNWLGQLGDEPLGETLQSRADVSRSDFEYALLAADSVPGNDSPGATVWARRSSFFIGKDALTVTEVFLGGLDRCAAAESK